MKRNAESKYDALWEEVLFLGRKRSLLSDHRALLVNAVVNGERSFSPSEKAEVDGFNAEVQDLDREINLRLAKMRERAHV